MRSPYRTRAQLVIILSMWVVCKSDAQDRDAFDFLKALYNGRRSVCRQDLGLVNAISLDLDRLNYRLRLLQLAHCFVFFGVFTQFLTTDSVSVYSVYAKCTADPASGVRLAYKPSSVKSKLGPGLCGGGEYYFL